MSRSIRGVLALTACCGLLSACGSDSSPSPPRAADTASAPATAPVTATQPRAKSAKAARPDPVSSTSKPQRAKGPTKHDLKEGGADTTTANPCRLVTSAEAGTIVGRRVARPQTAPLGPTCIYRPQRGSEAVTLSVVQMPVAGITRHSRNVIRATVGGRRAYCVNDGALKMLVPLASGRVLNVTAPCPIAARFAAKAIGRLQGG